MKIDKRKLGEVCDFVGGSQPPKSEFLDFEEEGYVRLIQTRDYKTNNFKTYIPKESTKKFCGKSDIMIGRYGPPIFQILRGLEGAYNVALMKAIPSEEIGNEYLFYFLKQESLFQYIDQLSPRTGGQTGVDVPMLKEYPILLPEIEYQRKVEKVLCSFDEKIELNNKINTELEVMAKLIYDYWFVQFDFPDEKGKPYKSSGGKMVYSDELKREIPEGWEVNELASIAEFKNGKGIKKERIKESGEFVIFGSNGPTGKTDDILFENPVVAIGRVGANYGEVNYSLEPCWITDNAVTSQPIDTHNLWWLILTLRGIDYKNIAGGSAQPLITQGKLKSLKFPIPKIDIIKNFHEIANSTFRKVENNQKENQKLAELRDWLLPMLMNGQVRVGEVDKIKELI